MTEILEQCPFVASFAGGMIGGALIVLGVVVIRNYH